jgi:carbonic anhydrase
MSYPIVQQRVRLGEVQLSGWWFNIAGGEMLAYQRTSRTFEPIDRRTAESFISQLESGSR